MADRVKMKRNRSRFSRSLLVLLLLSALAAMGCSDQKASTVNAHPADYTATHGPDADADLTSCTTCHGANFTGMGGAPSCYDCHVDGPPFGIHPVTWTSPLDDHLTFANQYSWTTCDASVCHGNDLRGGFGVPSPGPSCFQVEDCHGEGPLPDHELPYIEGDQHGPTGKNQQLVCRNCHGVPPKNFDGGFVSDPAILNREFGSCTVVGCHTDAKAHPTNWQGDDGDTTHRTIDPAAIDVSCVLCHKVDGPGEGAFPGAPSCFSSSFTNADGTTSECHPGGPPIE